MLLVVDGAQSVGVLDIDVKAMKIDALATSSQKYLMGLYGLGFLYVRDSHVERPARLLAGQIISG